MNKIIKKDKRQKNHGFFSYNFFPKNRRGISVMIGYILLITIAIIISTIVYQWLKTYVPTEALECPDGVSVFVEDYVYDCTNNQLNFTLKNNGRFNIAGYFIHGTTSETQELAVEDLSPYNEMGLDGSVVFTTDLNSLSPNEKVNNTFDFSSAEFTQIYSLGIIPLRYQTKNNKERIVICSDARIKQELVCHNETPVNALFNAIYSNTCKNCGSAPPGMPNGYSWWYYNTTLQELGGITGITVNNRQKCYSTPNLGSDCGSVKTDIVDWFGTNYISPGEQITWNNNAIWTNDVSITVTETFNGIDDNGNFVTTSYTFTVS